MSGEDELRKLIASLCKEYDPDIGPDDDLPNMLGLDSLAALRVVAAVEKRFDVRFPDDRITELRTLNRLVAAIDERQEEQEGES